MAEGFTDGPLTPGLTTEERGWAMAAHLSALLAVWAGYLGILGTLIIWLIKRNEMRYVDEQGKESLNFQINMFVLGIAILDRKSTRLNSSHTVISYAVFCL